MKTTTTRTARLAAALFVCSAAGAAHADPSSVRLGAGAAASADAQGLSLDLRVGAFVIEATAQADHVVRSAPASDSSGASFSIGALGELARRDRVALLAGVRVDLHHMTPSPPAGAQYVEPAVTAPVRIQLDVTPWLSLDAEAALELFRISGGGVDSAQTTTPSSITGGFTVWF